MCPCTEVGVSQGTESCLHLPESHQLLTPLFPADPISRASRTNQLTQRKWYGEEAGVELGGPRHRTLALWFSFHGLVPPVSFPKLQSVTPDQWSYWEPPYVKCLDSD